jgi:hypothetical protein
MALGIFKWEMVWHICKFTAVMCDACAAACAVRATWQLDISRREQRQSSHWEQQARSTEGICREDPSSKVTHAAIVTMCQDQATGKGAWRARIGRIAC